jgi:hypothetical protein
MFNMRSMRNMAHIKLLIKFFPNSVACWGQFLWWQLWCAYTGQPACLQVGVQTHSPWCNPSRRSHMGWKSSRSLGTRTWFPQTQCLLWHFSLKDLWAFLLRWSHCDRSYLPWHAGTVVTPAAGRRQCWLHLSTWWCPPPPLHYHNDVRGHLKDWLPQRWFGRAAFGDQELLHWPPRSPDLTPCDFFLWGYIKDRVFVPPLANTLVDLRACITAAITEIDPSMLQRVWEELDYQLDVCCVTCGMHIEHL